MDARCDLSKVPVCCLWRTFGLQPPRGESFQLSTGSLFVEKVWDEMRLYVRSSTDNAHEKSQI